MEKLIEIKNLFTSYFTDDGVVKALDDVSLDLYPGEAVGIVGESGCGKSTLGLSIMRLIRPPGRIVDGEILFQGEDILKMDQEKVRNLRGGSIAMIFQDPMSSLNPVFNIGNQIEETIQLHQEITSNEELTQKVIEILQKVGISDPDKRLIEYPHQFSGGMRQRVMIAMALSCNPNLLIADEPTTSLDVTIQAQILDLMTNLKQDFQSAILLITHNVAVVAEFCDKAAVMYGGKIVEIADVTSIFKKPKHPYTKALLGSVPRVDSTLDELVSIPGEVPSLINPPNGCIFHPRCNNVMEKCRSVDPKLIKMGDSHEVACLLYKKKERSHTNE
jgi:oligopeptide/dipeptide ABC transporter ATP-binding protein